MVIIGAAMSRKVVAGFTRTFEATITTATFVFVGAAFTILRNAPSGIAVRASHWTGTLNFFEAQENNKRNDGDQKLHFKYD